MNSTNNPKLTKNISMESFSEEFLPVASESYEFENSFTKNTNWTFSHAHPINTPVYGTKLESVPSMTHFEIMYVISDLLRRIQFCSFREERVGISG